MKRYVGWLCLWTACTGVDDAKVSDTDIDTELPSDTDVDTNVPVEDPPGCHSPNVQLDDSGGLWTLETEHFRLLVQPDAVTPEEAEELAAMAEAAWDGWVAYFGVEPVLDTRLEALLATDASSFRGAIQSDGDTPPSDAGGYYSPTTGRAYWYTQPSEYYNRVLMLHELTHQFHDVIAADAPSMPTWYAEGVAEYLGRHYWRDRCVTLGVAPLATLEDFLEDAAFDADPTALTGWLDGDAFPSRGSMLAFWRFLQESEGTASDFDAWRRRADAGEVAFTEFSSTFDVAGRGDAYVDWVEANRYPFEIVYVSWSPVGPAAIEAWSTVSSVLRWKAGAPASFGVTHLAPTGGLAGLLVGFDDVEHQTLLMVDELGELQTLEINGTDVRWSTVGMLDSMPASVSWTLTHSESGAEVQVGGQSFTIPTSWAHAAGLAIYDDEVVFEDVMVTP